MNGDNPSLLTLKLPKELGGLEADLRTQFLATEAASRKDGSAGWNETFTSTSGAIAAARLSEEGLAEVAASATGGAAWPPFAGTFVMSGHAVPASDGGAVVTGRWGFASGIVDASWVVAGCTTESGLVWSVIPVEQVTVHDTWQVSGLEETQSHDYSVDEVFVPPSRLFGLAGAPPRGGILHRLPMYALITPDHCGVSLGIARRALDEIAVAAKGKNRLYSPITLDERPAFQRDLGQADTKLRAARALVLEVLDEIWEAGVAGEPVEDEVVQRARAAATHAADTAVEVASIAYRRGGGSVLYSDHPLNQCFRDAHAATQHVHVTDEMYELVGANLLGKDPD
ncbi:acyl-CoA dehydrogenase family protein [Candidatus Poriferisocius sp.]|uniref:acyl-CoA dehydrogenase family protein n=1 Tax=Candidatus Poriferisocius sp. TaxID=3101276 RepID=UPI003B01D140